MAATFYYRRVKDSQGRTLAIRRKILLILSCGEATLGPHSKELKMLFLNSCALLIKAVDWLLLKLLLLDLHIRRP